MIGPEERLMALGVPAETAREMVRLFGGGSTGTPLLAANNLSDLVSIVTARSNLGLGELAVLSSLEAIQTATITPSGSGTAASPFQAAVRVSANPDNALQVEADGLRVPTSASGVPEAPDDGEVYGRGSEAWQALGSAAQADTSHFATAAQGAAADTAVQPGDLAAVATSGSYDDLDDKPTIPAAQVNSDWSASSGVAEILNKPTIPTSPGGDFVGTTAAQTLEDKTLGRGTKEFVEVLGDLNIYDEVGPFMQVELAANTTAYVTLDVGVSRSLWINPATYTVTIPSGTTQVNFPDDGLPASKWSLITFTGKPGSTDGIAIYVSTLP